MRGWRVVSMRLLAAARYQGRRLAAIAGLVTSGARDQRVAA